MPLTGRGMGGVSVKETRVPELRFGKYAGIPLSEVPTAYLEFLLHEQERMGKEIPAELERRRLAEEANQSWLERIISTGYRTLAREHHPDIGGDGETMKEINAAAALLRSLIGKNGDNGQRAKGQAS